MATKKPSTSDKDKSKPSAADSIISRLASAHHRAADAISKVYMANGKEKIDSKTGQPVNVNSTAFGVDLDISKRMAVDENGEIIHVSPYVCPFGIPQIDVHLQRDASGRMGLAHRIYIVGDRDTGKSTKTKRLVINCLNSGGIVVFFDVDGQFDSGYLASGIPGTLNKTGREGLSGGRLRYNRVGSFHELYAVAREVVAEMKHAAMAYASENKLNYGDVVFTRDVCPMLFVIDGFSSLFTLADSDKELDEGQKMAAPNTDIHRMFKQLQTNIDLLGIPMVLTGHLRMKSAGQVYWRDPAFLTSLQDYVQVVLVNTKSKDSVKIRDSIRYTYSTNTEWKFMKLKKSGPTTGKVGPLKFVTGRGYDLGYDCLAVLSDAGFLASKMDRDAKTCKFPDTIKIVETNKLGDSIPSALQGFVCDEMSKSAWLKIMRANNGEKYKEFYAAVENSLSGLTPMLLKDGRELGVEDDDDVVEDVEESDSEPEAAVDDSGDEEQEVKSALKRRGFGAPK